MENKKKLILTITLITTMLIITLGFTYAAFIYRENTNNQQLVLGEIYMYYNEINQLTIENAMPGEDYSKYFEFTINGKNTYKQKDISYDVILTRGDTPDDKIETNRLSDNSLLFKLVEVNGETETILLQDITYDDLTSQILYTAIIEKGTTTEINKKYRLYAKIGDNITICGGEIRDGCDYFTNGDTLNWTDAFASVKINVTGVLKEAPKGPPGVEILKTKAGTGGLEYTSQDDYRYKGLTVDNYVFFDTNGDGNKTADEIWRIVGVFKDTVKDGSGNVVLNNGEPTYEEKIKLVRHTMLTNELPATYTINGNTYTIKGSNATTAYWGENGDDVSWSTAGLQHYLNTARDENNVPNAGYLSFFTNNAKELLSLTTYYLGSYELQEAMDYMYIDSLEYVYNSERSGNTWNGYIGLLYASDIGFALTDIYPDGYVYVDEPRWVDSWLGYGQGMNDFWLITPVMNSHSSSSWGKTYPALNLISHPDSLQNSYSVYPSLYLKSSTILIDATGTYADPYVVVIE